MAVTVLKNVGVTIAGTDISDHVREVAIDDGYEELDDTVMTHLARSTLGGLATPSITVKCLQDYAAGKTHELFRAAVNTSTAVIIRRDRSAVRSGTNPEWEFTGKVFSYNPITGGVGTIEEPAVLFKSTGTPFSYKTAAT